MLVYMQHASVPSQSEAMQHAKNFHANLQTCHLVSLQTSSMKFVVWEAWEAWKKSMWEACGKACEKHSSPVTIFLLYTCKANLVWRGSLQS